MAIDAGTTAFMIVSMALVNLMTPGLAFFYGGLVRSSNVLTIMMQNYVSMGLITLVWVAWGYSLCFGTSKNGVIGSARTHYFLENLVTQELPYAPEMPGLVFAGFQGMFAVIAPSLMTGAFADRVRFVPYVLFIFFWVHLVYFPFAHWVWGGGWMARNGVKDFAGGIVVHITAGFSALATVVALPNRRKLEGEDVDTNPHNIPFVALGTGLLWFGWFGFNGGSALAADERAALAAMNSEISASAALFFWLMLEWKMEGKPTLVGACVGAIAGLATITPCARVRQAVGRAHHRYALRAVVLRVHRTHEEVQPRRRARCVGPCTVWVVFFGTLCVGIFSSGAMTGNDFEAGGKLFGKQLLAAVGCAAYSFVMGLRHHQGSRKVHGCRPPAKATAGWAWTSPCTARRAYSEDPSGSKKRRAPSTSNDITPLNNRRRTVVVVNSQ